MPPQTVDSIITRGFRSIASVDRLRLRPINILIGANGSGKSNFLGGFALLQSIAEGRLREYVTAAGGAEKILHFGSKTTREIHFHLSFRSGEYEYDLHLSPTQNDGLFPSAETCFPSEADLYGIVERQTLWQQGREAFISNPRWHEGPEKHVRDYLTGWRVYHLNDTSSSSPILKTAKVDDNRFLRADGSNLAAFLYFLQEWHQETFGLIQRTVQRVAPFFDRFQLAPLNLAPGDIKLEWRHKRSDQYFDASSLSDGTVRFLALATLFLQPEKYCPSVILVDEPELGLHPYAIEILASLIRQVSVNTQVIVSTQSSLLVDHFAPEDVLVANLVSGGTRIERLDPAQLAEWLKDYSLGQLWEKNELEGRPAPD